MQHQSRESQVARARRGVEPTENQPEAIRMLDLDSRLVAAGEEPFEALVAEAANRHKSKCNACGNALQPGLPAFAAHRGQRRGPSRAAGAPLPKRKPLGAGPMAVDDPTCEWTLHSMHITGIEECADSRREGDEDHDL